MTFEENFRKYQSSPIKAQFGASIAAYKALLHADGYTDLHTPESLLSANTIEAKRESYRCGDDFAKLVAELFPPGGAWKTEVRTS